MDICILSAMYVPLTFKCSRNLYLVLRTSSRWWLVSLYTRSTMCWNSLVVSWRNITSAATDSVNLQQLCQEFGDIYNYKMVVVLLIFKCTLPKILFCNLFSSLKLKYQPCHQNQRGYSMMVGIRLLHVMYVTRHTYIVNHALYMYMYVCKILFVFQEFLLQNSHINCHLRIT